MSIGKGTLERRLEFKYLKFAFPYRGTNIFVTIDPVVCVSETETNLIQGLML